MRWVGVCALAMLALLCTAAAASAGLVPGQGQLIPYQTKISGKCTAVTPSYPDSSNWGPAQDGTPFHATSSDSFFVELPASAPFDPNDEADFFYSVPDQRCGFNDGHFSPEDTLPYNGSPTPGVWVMYVVQTLYDETYDSVTGWVPQTDDNTKQVLEKVTFELTAHNPCDSPWQGVGPTAPYCLKQKQKQKAAEDAKTATNTVLHPPFQLPYNLDALFNGRQSQSPSAQAQKAILNAEMLAFAAAERKIAADPPDSSYRSIAKPRPLRVRGLSKVPSSTTSGRLLHDLARAVGLEEAALTSINRTNGAFVATIKDQSADDWTMKQNDAADNYISGAADQFHDAARRAARVKVLAHLFAAWARDLSGIQQSFGAETGPIGG